jgi:hypothetical protein
MSTNLCRCGHVRSGHERGKSRCTVWNEDGGCICPCFRLDDSTPSEPSAGIWVAFYSDLSETVVFDSELAALRHAVEREMSVKFIQYGEAIR